MELIHGGDTYGAFLKTGVGEAYLTDFSANLNPLGMTERIKYAIKEELEHAHHYPDPKNRKLNQAIGEKFSLKPEWIFTGNGGADVIYRLVYALRPKKALMAVPTFAEYGEALGQVGAESVYYQLETDFELKDNFLEYMSADIDLLFLCNPNNPTGLLVDRMFLHRVIERARELHIFCVIDECFLEFADQMEKYSVMDLVETYENLLILKSFTKLFAMPGLRLGFGVCSDRTVIEGMERAGQPWAVSTVAESAGLAALQETDYITETMELIATERSFLSGVLKKFGFRVYDGRANYLFFYVQGVEDLNERLLKKGILIRPCGNYVGLTKEYYRVAVRTREENLRLVQAIAEVL